MLDSWLAFPGYGRSQPDHHRGAGVEMLPVADGIVEVAVGFVLFRWQHQSPIILFVFETLTCSAVCVTNCLTIFNNIKSDLVACLVCIVAQNQKPRSLTAGPVLVLQVCWQINETPSRSEISSI
jgi:hypothetical protein